jgi:hypothetical protein
MTNDELTAYYQNLLTIQYNNKPKAQATIAAMVTATIANQVFTAVRDGFNINTAVGSQLDVLGKYVGVNRLVFGLNPNRLYFSMPAYADGDIGTVNGFAVYTQAPSTITWYFLQYSDVTNPNYSLTDDEMRRLIQFRAAVHSCDYAYKTLDNILFKFFGTNVDLQETSDMTITYHHNPADTDTLFAVVVATGSLPRPAGVLVLTS